MPETVKLNMDEMIGRFRFLGKNLAPTIFNAMLMSGQEMLRRGVLDHMSRPSGPKHSYSGSGPGQLGRDTGTARRSMVTLTKMTADAVSNLLGSPLGYVRAHEEGSDGIAKVRAHTRRLVVLTRSSRSGFTKVSKKSANAYKASLRRGGKRFAFVRAYDRKVHIVAKNFIRDSILDAVAPTEQRILKALMIAAKTGTVPSTGQLGGR